jgi:DNA-binding response OmpR family regulator
LQVQTLQGERLLIVEDEPLIAIDLQGVLESEGARVFLARTIPEALGYANYPALSAGVLDFHVGSENAEPVCEALMRREVPFIFFTGLVGRVSARWWATPIVSKPAKPETIIGALKFVLAAETRTIIVKSQRGDDAKLARIDQVIFDSEDRIQRMRHCITQLASSGADTSVAERVVATATELLENMRSHRQMSADLASKLDR